MSRKLRVKNNTLVVVPLDTDINVSTYEKSKERGNERSCQVFSEK